jgi:VWFA-related protein
LRCACIFVAAACLCTPASAADGLSKLNVAAVDSQGQPVRGLQNSDFQLQVDGKSRSISFFRFSGGAPLRATVILIDLLSDRMMTGSIMADEITHALKNLESSEGLYVYILTASGALYPIHAMPKPDTELTPEAEPWTRNIGGLLQTAFKNVFGFKPIDERDVVVRYQMTINALRDLGGQMKLASGRKSLVWVTHGVPLVGPSISEQGLVDFTNPLRLFCEEMERAQIVVYPVVESSRGAGGAVGTQGEQSLEEFANITGGRMYRSGGVGDALRQATQDARGNYQIGYYSEPVKPDGKHHKYRVTCARKEVRVQTEAGFYAVLAPEQPDEAERNAALIAAHSPFDASDIGVKATMSPDPNRDKYMRFEIHVDPGDLLLSQAGEHRTGKISLLFAVYGAEGVGQSKPIPVDISLTPEQYETALHGGLEYHPSLPIGPTVQRVRVIVVDRDLGVAGSVTIPVAR